MSTAVPLVLWFFVSAWWFLADAWLQGAMGGWRVDLAVAFGVFAACAARPGALPWLIVCAGLGRALVLGGAAAVHVVMLGAPVVLLFPLRRLPAPVWVVHMSVAGVFALALPGMAALAQRTAQPPPPSVLPGLYGVVWAMLTAPVAAALLGRLPPLWFFREGTS